MNVDSYLAKFKAILVGLAVALAYGIGLSPFSSRAYAQDYGLGKSINSLPNAVNPAVDPGSSASDNGASDPYSTSSSGAPFSSGPLIEPPPSAGSFKERRGVLPGKSDSSSGASGN